LILQALEGREKQKELIETKVLKEEKERGKSTILRKGEGEKEGIGMLPLY